MNEACQDYKARQDQLRDHSHNGVTRNTGTKTLIESITGWHHERNLIEGSTDKDQFAKLIQEAGELSDSICKGKDVSDDIGDMMVVLINIAERNKLSICECLAKAWLDIKDRKGEMRDGVFVKESDL
jgi:NTP pyrophosphatase (non-canonical NTP hydrolase)